jgi:hypothetical protein
MDRVRRRRDTPAEAEARQQPLSWRNGSLGPQLWCLQEGPIRASCPNIGHSIVFGIDTEPSTLERSTHAAKRAFDPNLPVSEALHLKKLRSGQLASSIHRAVKGPNDNYVWKCSRASVATFNNAIHNVDPGRLITSTCSIIQDPDSANV